MSPNTHVQDNRPFDEIAGQLVDVVREKGLVVVAGAGLSMPWPSALPCWRDLNDAFLEVLCLRLAMYADDIPASQLLEKLIERRNTGRVLGPDYQAQVAEDTCGEDYYRVLAPLDIDAWNTGHAAIAALAQAGWLKAIVTTNFDRLIELALDASGVSYRVFKDIPDFEALVATISEPTTDFVPVIKAHGSVDAPTTMVDTLRQRTKGRPRVLEFGIAQLVANHATVIAGYSGADLATRPHYLGLANGAKSCPLMIIGHRAEDDMPTELAELREAAGQQGHGVVIELPRDLEELAMRLAPDARLAQARWDIEVDRPGMRAHALASEIHSEWARHLDPLDAATIVASLLEASGAIFTGVQVLQRCWRHIEDPAERSDEPFLRYSGLFSSLLLEYGLLGPNGMPLDRETGLDRTRDVPALRLPILTIHQAGVDDGLRATAFSNAARASYYIGAIAGVWDWLEDSAACACIEDAASRAGALLINAHVYGLLREADSGRRAAEEAYAIATETGDLALLARACASTARFRAATGELAEADARIDEACRAAAPLKVDRIRNEILADQGYLSLVRQDWDTALEELSLAAGAYKRMKRDPAFILTSIRMLYAAQWADPDRIEATRRDVESRLHLVPGLEIDYLVWFANAMKANGEQTRALNAATALAQRAELAGHGWALEFSRELRQELGDDQTPPPTTPRPPAPDS